MIGQVVFQRSAKEHRKGLGAFANAVHVGSQMIGYIDEQVFREAVAEGASLGHVAQGFLAVSFANGECPEIIDKIRMRERESRRLIPDRTVRTITVMRKFWQRFDSDGKSDDA